MKNKKGSLGSTLLIGLFALVYFMAGMVMYQFLKVPIDAARIDMACTSPSTWGDKGICLIIGSVVPLTILSVLSVTGGIVTVKMFR